jgi:hypothetical protein
MFRTTIAGIRRSFFTRTSSPVVPKIPTKYAEEMGKQGIRDADVEKLWGKSEVLDGLNDNKKCQNDLAMVTSTVFYVIRYHRHSIIEMLDIAEAAVFGEDNELLKKYVIAGAMKKRYAIPRTFFGDPVSQKI